MGDESSFRYRRDDGYGDETPGARAANPAQGGEDPLAELARLIGEEDPFADFADISKDAPTQTRTTRTESAPRPQFSAPPVERRFDDWQPGRRTARDPQPAPDAGIDEPTVMGRGRAVDHQGWDATAYERAVETQRTTVRSGYGSLARKTEAEQAETTQRQLRYSEAAPSHGAPGSGVPARDGEDPSAAGYAYGAESDRADYDAYDDSYDPAFGEEGYMPPHGEEIYETEPRRRRSRVALIAAAAVLGLGLAATAGYFVLLNGGGDGSASSENAPVIKADTTPSKVAGPAPASQGTDGQKLIYDRVGGAPAGTERVVPREEQPMDVNAAAAANAGRVLPGATPVSPTEPKKVRTVSVRADGSVVPATASTAAPAPQASGVAPTAYAPTQNPLPAGAPQPKTVTTISTDGRGASAGSAAPAAPPAQQAAVSPPPAVATGSYVVQVSSQRTEADALGSWKVLQGRYPQLLGAYTASVRKADLGERGIYYRAQVGPFAGRDDANTLCNALRAQGGDCVVTRN
ncbi:SPOR domain-containing protein [Aquabacter spiritensis]|uniref:Cell division septation protein DedD n=1 Tax=Aquabacter spiritensis TaxID=933073 RepID=A0A4R3LR25_9HYPH|nr:SPOR domain-containing protein [Aquabacter spiritensis]TCT02850.1 cell division septation protein DedD [Aquabacter spiritensis]